jgi:hypothetical protein
MVASRDPRAEKIKARKEAKAELRRIVREDGIVAAAKFHLSTPMADAPSEECQDCLALNKPDANKRYQFLRYDSRTHRAHVREIRG